MGKIDFQKYLFPTAAIAIILILFFGLFGNITWPLGGDFPSGKDVQTPKYNIDLSGKATYNAIPFLGGWSMSGITANAKLSGYFSLLFYPQSLTETEEVIVVCNIVSPTGEKATRQVSLGRFAGLLSTETKDFTCQFQGAYAGTWTYEIMLKEKDNIRATSMGKIQIG